MYGSTYQCNPDDSARRGRFHRIDQPKATTTTTTTNSPPDPARPRSIHHSHHRPVFHRNLPVAARRAMLPAPFEPPPAPAPPACKLSASAASAEVRPSVRFPSTTQQPGHRRRGLVPGYRASHGGKYREYKSPRIYGGEYREKR